MTTYRLMDGLAGRPGNGPSSVTSYSGPFLAGTCFSVTGRVMWFQGYWWWVPPGGDTGAQKFALWNHYASSSNQLVAGSVVTSGALTAGQWNFVPLPAPIPLAPGTQYVAATGWTVVSGFPDTQNQFGAGQPYAAGITNGPLTAWSDPTSGGTNNYPSTYSTTQGLFSASAGTDPSVNMPNQGSNTSNFWVDVSVSDTAPAGFAGPWQMFPNMTDADGWQLDLARNYIVATEIILSGPAALSAIRYYSPNGSTQLATDAALWNVATQQIVPGTHLVSPSWSGAAGSGWIQANYGSPPVIPAGDYKIAIFNGAGTPGAFNATTASYFISGFGASGLSAGPVTCPNAATATAPGQGTYQDTTGAPAFVYPNLYVAGQGQNYWLDALFTPVASGLLMASFP